MSKQKAIRVRKELVAAAKRTIEEGRYRNLSDFVSEAIRLRLDELKRTHEKVVKRVEHPVIKERLLHSFNHIWAMVTPEGNVRVGLSDYAIERLRGIAGIQTHPVGYEVKKGEPIGVVETWMFMFDLYSPVSGRISRINRSLQNNPFALNENPHEPKWIAEINPSNLVTLEEELRGLMKLPEYKEWAGNLGRSRILSL